MHVYVNIPNKFFRCQIGRIYVIDFVDFQTSVPFSRLVEFFEACEGFGFLFDSVDKCSFREIVDKCNKEPSSTK